MPNVRPILVTADEANLVSVALSLLAVDRVQRHDDAEGMMALVPVTRRFVDIAKDLSDDDVELSDRLEGEGDPVGEMIRNADFIPAGESIGIVTTAFTFNELANVVSLLSFGLKYEVARGANVPDFMVEMLSGLAAELVEANDGDSSVLGEIMGAVDHNLDELVELINGKSNVAPGPGEGGGLYL